MDGGGINTVSVGRENDFGAKILALMDVIHFAIAVLFWFISLITGSLNSTPLFLQAQCFEATRKWDWCQNSYYGVLIGMLFSSLFATALFVGVLYGVLKGKRPLIILGMVLAVLTCLSALYRTYEDCIGGASNYWPRDSKSASYGSVFAAINGFLFFFLFKLFRGEN